MVNPMQVAGPINNPDEARALEQAAYLTDLRIRLTAMRGRRPMSPTPPSPRKPFAF